MNEKKGVCAVQRRIKSHHENLLSQIHNELVEGPFAYLCDAGDARCSWPYGFQSVTKRQPTVAAAWNLSTIKRMFCGIGSAKALQAPADGVDSL